MAVLHPQRIVAEHQCEQVMHNAETLLTVEFKPCVAVCAVVWPVGRLVARHAGCSLPRSRVVSVTLAFLTCSCCGTVPSNAMPVVTTKVIITIIIQIFSTREVRHLFLLYHSFLKYSIQWKELDKLPVCALLQRFVQRTSKASTK